MKKTKIIRTSTIALSLNVLLKGQLRFLNSYFTVIALSGKDANLIEVAQREDVKTISVSISRPIRLFKDITSLINLYLVFKKEKPQLVHSITPKAGLLTMIAAYFAKVPVRVHSFTGLIFPSKTGVFQKLLIAMDKLLCYFATHIYPEGEGVKKDLLAYSITKKPLQIIANGNINGIDTTYFNANKFTNSENTTLKKNLNIQPTDFVYIFVGRLVKDKGINELVEAFVQLNKAHVKLLLVGPLEQELDPLAPKTLQKIKDSEHIITTGYQTDVRPYFAISNALVFPSYREGFPNVVMQAGAMGLPSIVSNINGCNEIISEAKNGLIIPSKNSDKLYVAMSKLVADKSLYKKLASNARNMITERYEQKLVWNAILQEYNNLLKNYNV